MTDIEKLRELLDEKEYPIAADTPLGRYAVELRNAIGPLRTDLAYYQAKWEHELSTVSKLERERDALRREVEERQKAMILKTAEIGLLRAILADTEPVAKFEFAADGNYLKLKWRPNYVCKDGDKLYLHPYGMKERAEAAERELAACREDAERWNRIHDLVCVHDGVFRLYTLDESKFALDSNLIHGGARLKAAIDAAIIAAKQRERDAALCDGIANNGGKLNEGFEEAAENCAKAIRGQE